MVQMDADGQHPPSAIPALVKGLANADIVIASRFLGDPGYPVPPLRRATVRLLGHWASLCAGQPLTDVTSGFRAWSPTALTTLVPDYPLPIADANLLVRALQRGLRVEERAVPMRARTSGQSQHEGVRALWFAVRMGMETGRERWGR